MDRIRRLWSSATRSNEVQYEPVPDGRPQSRSSSGMAVKRSNFEYMVFLMLGCAMLWAWSMFMACTTYFQGRFAENSWILKNFQSSILFVSCFSNFTSVMYLSSATGQNNADYPKRVKTALFMNMAVFTFLAFSAVLFRDCSAEAYFVFVLVLVFATNVATGLSQNGVFALVSGYPPICTQAIMTGQGLAGVLPGLAQILSVLAAPASIDPTAPASSPRSAFFSFFTATLVSGATLILFNLLLSRRPASRPTRRLSSASDLEKPSIPLIVLLSKLRYQVFSISFNFCITMMFPIFTQVILSTHPEPLPRLLRPDVFIPLSFVIWNLGDLLGRFVCAWPIFHVFNPKLQAIFALGRLGFIPFYYMCNLHGNGAKVGGDTFFWTLQLLYGVSNGWVGSNVMMAAPSFVEEEMREATGGFMGACIMGGLTVGSLLGFVVVV